MDIHFCYPHSMIVEYLNIIGTPILGHESGDLIALLKDLIIDPDTGKIEGIWVKPLTLPMSEGVILAQDLIEWKKNIYIRGEQVISEADDIIRITEILEKNAFFIGNRVENQAGEILGKVYSLDFDTRKLYLQNLYIQKSFLILAWNQRMIPYDAILEVLPKVIIINDKQKKKAKEPVVLEDTEMAAG